MGLSLSAEQKTIIDLFAKTNKYVIPSYQRPYSWGKKECSELWDDLKFIFDSKDSEEYFLGNIVLAKSKEREEIEVIDGQQRLITLTILLKVLHILAPNRDLQEAIWNISRRGDETSPRVKTMVFEDNDNENFKKVLDLTEEEIEHLDIKNMNQFEENLYFFYKELKELTLKDKQKIIKFGNFLLDDIYILPIQSIDIEEEKAREKALIIFETINNRGLDLSDADIFKAQLYNSASNKRESELFINKWRDLVDLAKDNEYSLVEVFRIYSHILRGKNREKGTEIALRAFFAQEKEEDKEQNKDGHIPLRKRDYNEVLDELYKIILTINMFNQASKTNIQPKLDRLTKWFQIINEYRNSYPKYIIFIYLFFNAKIDDNDELILDNKQIEELELLAQNIIKYAYLHSSAMKIKFEIFKLIEKIAKREAYSFKDIIEKVDADDFKSFGNRDSRKKSFALLSIYLDKEQQAIYPYYFDTIIKKSNIEELNDSWREYDYDSYANSIGNQVVLNVKRKTRALKSRIKSYENSSILDLQELSKKLNDFSYQDYKEREKKHIDRLISFFSKDTLW